MIHDRMPKLWSPSSILLDLRKAQRFKGSSLMSNSRIGSHERPISYSIQQQWTGLTGPQSTTSTTLHIV